MAARLPSLDEVGLIMWGLDDAQRRVMLAELHLLSRSEDEDEGAREFAAVLHHALLLFVEDGTDPCVTLAGLGDLFDLSETKEADRPGGREEGERDG
jgi:hypothetical protein